MPTSYWIALGVGLGLVAFLLFLLVKGGRDRKLERQRREADELRKEAEEQFAEAGRREALAERAMQQARREREAAVHATQQADDLDPDVDDPRDD